VSLSLVAAAPPGNETALLVPFVLPGGVGAHKWRDRSLLESLAAAVTPGVPLLIDSDGAVLEAARANVWIVEGDALITPPADGRILPGITRAQLIAGVREESFDLDRLAEAREESFDLDRLAEADAVFLTSSIAGRREAALSGPRPRASHRRARA
jgi:para-aminobenzoate synthetase/4-amino-4-deoxychorismate lyase